MQQTRVPEHSVEMYRRGEVNNLAELAAMCRRITLSLACVKRSQVTEDAGRGDCGAGARIGVSDDAGSVIAGRWRVSVTRGTVTSALTGCWIAFPLRRQV